MPRGGAVNAQKHNRTAKTKSAKKQVRSAHRVLCRPVVVFGARQCPPLNLQTGRSLRPGRVRTVADPFSLREKDSLIPHFGGHLWHETLVPYGGITLRRVIVLVLIILLAGVRGTEVKKVIARPVAAATVVFKSNP